MSRTIIATGADQAVKRYSAYLSREAVTQSYWLSKFMGVYRKDSNKPITLITNLEKEAGDSITYDLVMRLRGAGTEGDNTLKGNEEKLVPYTDTLLIDQLRHGVDTGGKMTKKRTVHDLRAVARDGLVGWFAEVYDENIQAYLSGMRGSLDTTWVNDIAWTGRAGNSFAQPDTDHIIYGGDATTPATLAAEDIMDLSIVDKCVAHAATTDPMVQPIMIDGAKHFVLLMHEFDAYNLRTNTSTGQWLDIQKAAAAKQGQGNPIFTDALGMYNNVILHKHRKVVRFDAAVDTGVADSTFAVDGSRCLFFGAQAGAIAFGSPGEGLRYDWHEELEDRGNVLVVDVGAIFGVKKCTFNSKDFGVIAVDVASTDPVS